MFGYMGKILYVDLSKGKLWDEPLRGDYARNFLGGSGLAARMIFDMVDSNTDPLAPENPLVFMTGPLVGTAMPSAGRYSVCALSPLTRIWGEANSGGFFGPELRFTGYDGIVITGCAGSPVWLSIVNGKAELRDASPVWGKDCYETQEYVKVALGEQKTRVVCIGLAGENKVKMACIINDHGRAAGRTGMGAVMGSKRLKAIGVRGSGRIEVANEERLRRLNREIISGIEDDIFTRAMRLAGTAGTMDSLLMYGDVPIRYYQQGYWEGASSLSGILMAEQYQNRIYACYRCPIGCGRETRAPRYGLDRADGPEYETIASFGP
jgi:aldehyde:ferredoxin oxidoreductase